MKNLDLNELLNSSIKNMANAASNYKSEAPSWFMPGQASFSAIDSSALFNSLSSQMIQFGIFHAKTLHKFSIYLPEEQYKFSNLDDVVKSIVSEERLLKLIFRSETSLVLISQEEIVYFDTNLDKIEVLSFTGTKLKSLKDSLKKIGKK